MLKSLLVTAGLSSRPQPSVRRAAGFAEQTKPGLPVIGTRGMFGVKRLFMGRIARELPENPAVSMHAAPVQA